MGTDPARLNAPELGAALGEALDQAEETAVLVVDTDLRVRQANRAAVNILGAELAVGAPLAAAVRAEDTEIVRSALVGGDKEMPSLLLRARTDPERPDSALVASLLTLDVGNEGSMAILIGRSATREVEREARILRARRWEIVGQLTSGVAHDLNNRLSTVTTFSDLLLGDAEPESQDAEDLAEIKQAGLDAAGITRKLDLFAGGHAGGQTDCAPPDVVRGFEKLIRRFVGPDITLETELSEACPRVASPPIRIEEMIIALVANARDAMVNGGTLTIRARRGTDAEGVPGAAVIEVQDTGTLDVIPPLERALEPFFSSKPHGIGSGLGLGTVHGIATELGGDIRMTRGAAGTTVTLILPGLEDQEAEPLDAPGEQDTSATPRQPLHLALIEPVDGARSALERGLSQHGHTVEAYATWEGLWEPRVALDAIVSDVPATPHAGDELLASIRTRVGEIPVLLLRRRASPRVTLPGTPGVLELAKPTDLAQIHRALAVLSSPGSAKNFAP